MFSEMNNMAGADFPQLFTEMNNLVRARARKRLVVRARALLRLVLTTTWNAKARRINKFPISGSPARSGI